MQVYEPREDSELIKRRVAEFAKGHVLDMGTGTGILALEASKTADSVIALDVNPEAVNLCKKKIQNNKILFYKSDLFEIFELGKIKRDFDLIIFNPPYLPNNDYADIALDGGKHGWELVERFLKKAKNFLKSSGKILLLISSITNKPKVERIMQQHSYRFRVLEEQKLAFESLYVYLVE